MPKANTLTPEVMLAIAKIPKAFDGKPSNWLESAAANAAENNAILQVVDDYFDSSWSAFFQAVAVFLQQNNFLPELAEEEEEIDPDTFDSFGMMDARNW